MKKEVSTVANVLVELAAQAVALKARVKGFSAENPELVKDIAKQLVQKSVLMSFEDEEVEPIGKAEAFEIAEAAVAKFVEDEAAKEALNSAGAAARTKIEALAAAIVAGGKEKSEALEEIEELVPSAEFAAVLLDKAITKEENKIAFGETKAKRFIRVARQILNDASLTESQKMDAILNLTRARFTAEENKAKEAALKAEADANTGNLIVVSREDGTSYEGVILNNTVTGGTVSYRVKSKDGLIQLIGVAQRLSYDITVIEQPVQTEIPTANGGDKEKTEAAE